MVVGAVVCNLVPGFSDMLNKNFTDKNPMAAFNGAAIGTVLIYIWYFLACKKSGKWQEQGNIYMVLLILGVVGKIVSMVIAKSAASISSFDFIIDALGLYYYYKVRKGVKVRIAKKL